MMKTNRQLLSLLLVLILCLGLLPAALAGEQSAPGEEDAPALIFYPLEVMEDRTVAEPTDPDAFIPELNMTPKDQVVGIFAYLNQNDSPAPLSANDLTVPDGLGVEIGADLGFHFADEDNDHLINFISVVTVDTDYYAASKPDAANDLLSVTYDDGTVERAFSVRLWTGTGIYTAPAPTLANTAPAIPVSASDRDTLKVYFVVPEDVRDRVDHVSLDVDPDSVSSCLDASFFTEPKAVAGTPGVWEIGLRPNVELPQGFSLAVSYTQNGWTQCAYQRFRYLRDRLFFQRVEPDDSDQPLVMEAGDDLFCGLEPEETGPVTILGRFFLGEPVPGGGNLVPVAALVAPAGMTITQHAPANAPYLAQITIQSADPAKYVIGVKDDQTYMTPGNDDENEGKVIEAQAIPGGAYFPLYLAVQPEVAFYTDPACREAVTEDTTLSWELSTLYARLEGELPETEQVDLVYKSGMTPDYVTVTWDEEHEVFRFEIDLDRAYPQHLPPVFGVSDLALGLRANLALLDDGGEVIDVVGSGDNRGFYLDAPKLLYRYVVCDRDKETGELTNYRLGDWYKGNPLHFERDPIDLAYYGEGSFQTVVFYWDDGSGEHSPTLVDPEELFIRKGENEAPQFEITPLELEGNLESCFVTITPLTGGAPIDQTVGVLDGDEISGARRAIHCHLPTAAFYTAKERSVDTLVTGELVRGGDWDGELYFIVDATDVGARLHEVRAWVEPAGQNEPVYGWLEWAKEDDDPYAAVWKVCLNGDAPEAFPLLVAYSFVEEYPGGDTNYHEDAQVVHIFYDGMVFSPWRNDGQGFYPVQDDQGRLDLRFPLYTSPCDLIFGAFYHLDARRQDEGRLTLLYPADGAESLAVFEGQDVADGFAATMLSPEDLKQGAPAGAAFRIFVPKQTLDGRMELSAKDGETYTAEVRVNLGRGSFYAEEPAAEDVFRGRINTGEVAVAPGQALWFQLQDDVAAGVTAADVSLFLPGENDARLPVSWAGIEAVAGKAGLYKLTFTEDANALDAALVQREGEAVLRNGADLRVALRYQDPLDENHRWEGVEGLFVRSADLMRPIENARVNINASYPGAWTASCRINYLDPSGDQAFLFCALYDREDNYLGAVYQPQPLGNRGGWDARVELPRNSAIYRVKFILTGPDLRPHCAAVEAVRPSGGISWGGGGSSGTAEATAPQS